MLKALRGQIKDIRRGSTAELPAEYGHAIGVIAQAGQDEYLMNQSEEVQVQAMRKKVAEEVIKYGSRILDFLRPELRALIQPEDVAGLEEEHQMILANKGREKK